MVAHILGSFNKVSILHTNAFMISSRGRSKHTRVFWGGTLHEIFYMRRPKSFQLLDEPLDEK